MCIICLCGELFNIKGKVRQKSSARKRTHLSFLQEMISSGVTGANPDLWEEEECGCPHSSGRLQSSGEKY